jgi:hypothetical protein
MTENEEKGFPSEIERLEVLFGPKPLLLFQNRFGSREELLQFYADGVMEHFSAESAVGSRCEICQREVGASDYMINVWSARSRIYWGRVVVLLLFSPVLVGLALVHAVVVLDAIVRNMRMTERVSCKVVHAVCESCRRGLRTRAILNGCLMFILLVAGIVCTIGLIIVGAVLIAMAVGAFGFRPGDMKEALPAFLAALIGSAGSVAIGKWLGLRVLLPASLRSVLKKPFRLIHTEFRQKGDLEREVRVGGVPL